MELARKFLPLILFLVQAEESLCTHFRGGTFTYKPVNPSNTASTTVTISFRIGWRRSYSGNTYCDQSTISSGQLIGPSGDLECQSGCYGTVSSLYFRCTDFSVNEDWTTGTNTFQYTFAVPHSSRRYYEVSFSGWNWIALVYSYGASWQLRMHVNLTARNDTGRLNTSPVSTMTPIVRLKWGCNHTITIPVTDADNDEVRCRWATGYGECGHICGDKGLRYARINQRECKITYSATDQTGFFGVAVMIEDYAKPTDTQALSGIPLQFLVYVSRSNAKCDERPDFAAETRAKGSCIGIAPNGTYFDQIIVRAGGPLKSIIEVITNSPPGFIKSPVALYAQQEYYVNVTWTPTSSKIETKLFCFTGLEDSGITTNQRCVSLLVGVAPPEISSFFPTGEILPNTRQWTITFDKEFVRPTRSSYIRIHHSDGTVVFSVDVAITASVIYPVGRLGRNIQFTTSVTFTEKETYYVTLDPGVAKGVTYCGAESPAIRSPFTWSIKIKDVTPPTLTFVNAPSRSGVIVKIMWTANENVTSQCTLQTPTEITAQPCNMSWTGNNLTEGFYSIYVQLTDLVGNTAPPVRHTWFVDRTPPQVIITSKPAPLSNNPSFTFTFSCRETCTFECGVALEGNSPTFSQCNSKRYWVRNLQNGRIYVFQVKGTDDVGNQGDPVQYKWKVDLQSPGISSMSTKNVDCTSDLSPSVLGEPSASDNEGSNVTLTYRDIPGGSCSFQRKWTATDQAGNSASVIQVINLRNPTTPIVSYHGNATIACGSFEEQQQDMRDAINVTHPCNRPITITHSDSVASILCGTTFTRTWTITDDCGMQVSVRQRIRILALQLPEYPKNGQVNVALREALQWPQYPGSVRYNVYLWRYGDPKPTLPTTWTYYRSYSPSYPGYPADTRMLWRIVYVTNSGALIPSPVWGFQTRAFPDFKVEKILVPPNAFSGQTFDVSWTVRNIGKVGNVLRTWYDAVLIGKSTDSRSARYATRVPHREILFQNDGYTTKGTVQLRNDEFGVFYVFVATDWYNTISDFNRSNDILLADSPVQVSLTPPPNLKVEKIVVPNPSFSGKTITITWSVKNYGMGVTAYGAWYDRVYLSRDNSRDWSDWLLGTFYHSGVLSVDASYTTKQPVTLPHKIFGNFSILVITDVYNYVYEHNDEDDNLKAQRFIISLSPPPDLVVTSITTASNYFTGERMEVQFQVSNEGLGEPFYHWWRDRVTITHITSIRRNVLGITRFSGVFPPSSVYTRTLYYVIPPSWQSGEYNITVQTDYNNDVFEFIYEDNNARTVQVNVTQKLPDLTVTHVNASVTADTVQAYLRVIFSVKNVGPGKTSEAPWFDAVYISREVSFSQSNALWLRDVPHRINLNSGAEYTFDTGPVRVNRDIFGQRHIHVLTDAYSSVREEDVNNNIGHFANVTFPQVVPDLVVINFTMVSSEESVLSDSEISLEWTVENNGTGSTLSRSWHDTLYLSSCPQVEKNSTRLTSALFHRGALTPNQRYHQVSTTRLPSKISGTYYLVLKVNQGGSLVEKDAQTNNLAWTPVKIRPAPLPDLTVITVSFVFEEDRRLLKVSWRASNIGSWMREMYSWVDKVVMSSSKGNIIGADAYIVASKVVSAKLDEGQGYELSVAFQIKNNIRGTFYVHVVTNADNTFAEAPSDSNNIGVSNQTLFVPPPLEARLILTIISNMPPQITLGVPFYIAFQVKNVGFVATTKTSWTDALYAYGRRSANRTEVIQMGVKLKAFPHIGALAAQAFYEERSSITVPRGLNSSVFIYGFADIHNPNAPDPNVPTEPGNVTHPTATPPAPPLVIINEGLLPDIQGTLGNRKVKTRGGQPLNVTFNVTNRGEYGVQGAWYNALYLSQDVLVDPFDAKLATVRATQLAVNSTLSLSVEVFIPYDTADSEYYLLLSVDSKNTIWESDEQNNEAYLQITINRTLSSDLAVVSVSSAGGQFVYGQDVTVNWKIRNNGSQRAEGYKCDTVYLSSDDVWQIEDVRVGNPMCSYVILEPYNAGANQDTPYSVTSKLPLAGLGGYHGLVKTRSNILDLNRRNNIAMGPKNINVTFPCLPLDDCVSVTLTSGEDISYIIKNVPDVKTLIVTVNSSDNDAVHELFVSHGKPATAYQYDGGSRFALSADQEVVIPETTAGTYYVMMRRSDTSPTVKPSQLCARIAKFEIIRVFPNQVAPLGNATLRLEGTLFGPKLEAFLSANETLSIKAEEVYRMGSTEVYATFITTNLVVGTTFHVKLVNLKTREETVLERSLVIKQGEPGRLETHVDFPEVLLVDNSGVITVSYENVGDTDILTPILSLSATGGVKLRPVQRDRLYSEAFSTVAFLAQALQGPGGILPPKAYGEATFDTVQSGGMEGMGNFALRMLVGNEQPHVYINSSNDLRPAFLSGALWAPVWENFLVSVGQSVSSFHARMSAVSTFLSRSGRRVNLLTDLVQFQLGIANGKLTGDPLFEHDDVSGQVSGDDLLPLAIQRIYSPLLSKRRHEGIFGVGWIAPWWEANVTQFTPEKITIAQLREELVFHAKTGGAYVSQDNKEVTVNNTELHFTDVSSSSVFVFDTVERHLKQIQRGEETITIEYSQRRPTAFKHSSGGQITVTYNHKGLVREALLEDKNGEKRRCFYMYDGTNLLSVTTGNRTTRYTYNLKGDLKKVIYPTFTAVDYSWNKFGLLSEVTSFNQENRLIQRVNFTYNWNGKVAISRYPQGDSADLVFNENGKMMEVSGDSFSDVRYESVQTDDRFTRIIKQGDQVVIKRTFNEKTRILTIVDANNHETEFLLGKNREILNTKDPGGFVYENVYNNDSKLIMFKYPDGKTEVSDYDRSKRLVKFTTRSGKTIKFEYNENGKIVKKDVEGISSSYFLHDREGNLVQATNNIGTIKITYDSDNRPSVISYPNGQRITYRFNNFQRRVALKESASGLHLVYTYDRSYRLAQIERTSRSGSVDILLKLEYNSQGMVSKRILGNGAYSEYSFYPKNFNLLRLVNYFTNGSVASYFEYEYDESGRIIQMNTTTGNWRYKYDAASQLIESQDPRGRVYHYKYDKRKNRVYVSHEPGNKTLYVANEVNQYITAGSYDIKYDDNGNMKERWNRDLRNDSVKLSFSPEDILLQAETPNKRCNYIYDGLGNLYKKKCGQAEEQYIIDPFGNPGADIIGKISDGIVTHFVHCKELGLVAFIDVTGNSYYYEFDGLGSVVGVLDSSGDRINQYSYDPFGRMLEANEGFPQDFTFIGQWGVMAERELRDIYWMRSRHYDAQLGRFVSIDPLGFSGKSINLYSYAANNPVMLKDPRGRCLPFNVVGGPLGAVLNAGTNVAAYVAAQSLNHQKITIGGIVSSTVTGLISSYVNYGKTIYNIAAGFGTSFYGSMWQQSIDDGHVDYRKALTDGINGAISSALPRMSPYCNEILNDLFDKTVKNIFVPKILPLVENMTEFFINWVRSLDPNDMIGPPGYGDARFISFNTPLNYKIRFENDPNATAPAQHVIILHTLDGDLDVRTFRIVAFGFGNYTRKLSNARALIQETIDLRSEKNIYVRVIAGIDVMTRKARWEFQSLDPETGEPPEDPRIGFLPPNNGTTGQGFVAFTVRPKKSLPSLSRIDAKASIYFDKNEPIDTPPIFNTIDSTAPSSNLSVLGDVMKVGTLAVDIATQDEGSGVQSVDIFYQKLSKAEGSFQEQTFLPLLSGLTAKTAFLPLSPGTKYSLLASAVDFVGNRQPMDWNRAITVDFELQKPSCDNNNNCSGRGNCTLLNFCVCDDGFYGVNCSLDFPLRFETPIINVMYSDTAEDMRTLLYLSAFIPDVTSIQYNKNFTLKIVIDDVPQGFTLSKGCRNGSRITLEREDFGDVWLTPKKDFSGLATLNITAQATTPRERKNASSQIYIKIEAVADVPSLNVSVPCYHWNSSNKIIPVSLESHVNDLDGSENLTITTTGFPTGYRLIERNFSQLVNGSNHTISRNWRSWLLSFNGTLKPFVLSVTALAEEKSNGDKANNTIAVNVDYCVTCEAVNNCSGRGNCSKVNICDCKSGFKGSLDCLTVSCERVSNCSGHGNCTGPNVCSCEDGYKTIGCSQVSCELVNHCSGQGSCSGPNVCTCHSGFKGLNCSEVTCELLSDCSNHGNCTGPNECTCETGFQGGEDCSKVSCELLNNCSGQGNCSAPNVCTCHHGFKGLNCSEVSCESLNNCSSHGACTGPNECTCEQGYQGVDCSEDALNDEDGTSRALGTIPIVVISVISFVLLFLLSLLLVYCFRKRRSHGEANATSEPQRKGSTRVYSVSQFPSTGWVFGPASDPTAKDIPLYSFQNPTYSTATLNDKDPFA